MAKNQFCGRQNISNVAGWDFNLMLIWILKEFWVIPDPKPKS